MGLPLDLLTAGPCLYTAINAQGLQLKPYAYSQPPEDGTVQTSLASQQCTPVFLKSLIAWARGHPTAAFNFKP